MPLLIIWHVSWKSHQIFRGTANKIGREYRHFHDASEIYLDHIIIEEVWAGILTRPWLRKMRNSPFPSFASRYKRWKLDTKLLFRSRPVSY